MRNCPVIAALVFALGIVTLILTNASPLGVSRLGLLVSEVMYQPLPPSQEEQDAGFVEASQFEFVEITNVSGGTLDCSGLALTGVVQSRVVDGVVLEAGEGAVLVADPEAFAMRYGVEARVIGTFAGALPDTGGLVQLGLKNLPTLAFTYRSALPWPATPRGLGFSLTLARLDEDLDHSQPDSWRASAEPSGSPGKEDPDAKTLPVYINEVLPRATVLDTYYRVAGYPTHPAHAPTAFIGQFVQDMRADPYKFTFIHLVAPDFVGHAFNWYSPQQDNAIRAVDKDIGEVFKLIDEDDRLHGKTAIILTSDHAGGGGVVLNNHIDPIWPKNYTISFHVWGPGVPAGADLYALNPATRTAPHPEQNPITTLETATMPIRNGDLGNLALSLLGMPAIPGSWFNHDHSMITGAENVEYVIGISVDGLGPLSLNRLGAEELPNIFRLRMEGAFTDMARTDDTHTYTNPNHTCMLTSRGTLDHAGVGRGHRITFNSNVQTTIRKWNGAYIASVFDVVKAFGHTCAFYSNKTKLDFLGRSYGAISGDSIELHNPNDIVVPVGGWGLTDDPSAPLKWAIPAGTVIPPKGYLTLPEDPGWRSSARPTRLLSHFGSAFSLEPNDSQLYLFASSDGAVSGFSHGAVIDSVPVDGSIIRQTTANGERFPLASTTTLGSANPVPVSSSLAITEFAFVPESGELRFIEVQNVSSQVIALDQGLALRGSYAFDFAMGSTLLPGQIALLSMDPDSLIANYALPNDMQVFGPLKVGEMDSPWRLQVSFVTQGQAFTLDAVQVENFSPWPYEEIQGGHALERRNPRSFGDDAGNWALAADPNGSPGRIANGRYADWAELYFADLDPELASTDSDPDVDGRPNLYEYAFGTDPLNDESYYDPRYVWGPARTGIVSLSYQRPLDITDILYQVETSTDLVQWTAANSVTLELGERRSVGNGLEEVTYSVAPPVGTRFLRVRVVQVP